MDTQDKTRLRAEHLKADKIYNERLKTLLEPDLIGKFVAIDVRTGDYFVGDEMLDAYDKGVAKHPGRTFVFKRIGFKAARFIGAYPS